MRHWMGAAILMFTLGCGPGDDGSNDPVTNAKDKLAEVKGDVEDEVVDKLDCSGTISQETRTLIGDALADAQFDPDKLVTTPEDLARFVGAVAVSTDTTAMLVGNVAQIARVGHLGAAHAGMWDALSCGEVDVIDCEDIVTGAVGGTATSTVVCEQDEPTAVRVEFSDACKLFVTENAGAVSFRRSDGAYGFEDFTLGSVRQVDGLLAVALEGGETHRMTVADGEGLSVATNSGKSCEERLTISRMEAESAAEALSVDIDAERLADEKTMAFATPSGPAVFTRSRACACPDPGAVVDWRWTGFLKGQGDANVRLTYREADEDVACGAVDVEILSWPEMCDSETTDCGKSVAQSLLGPLVSATCVGR